MHHPIFKLAALAGVVGIGLLVVLQAQRELDKQRQEEAAAIAQAEDLSGGVKSVSHTGETSGVAHNQPPRIAPASGQADSRTPSSRIGLDEDSDDDFGFGSNRDPDLVDNSKSESKGSTPTPVANSRASRSSSDVSQYELGKPSSSDSNAGNREIADIDVASDDGLRGLFEDELDQPKSKSPVLTDLTEDGDPATERPSFEAGKTTGAARLRDDSEESTSRGRTQALDSSDLHGLSDVQGLSNGQGSVLEPDDSALDDTDPFATKRGSESGNQSSGNRTRPTPVGISNTKVDGNGTRGRTQRERERIPGMGDEDPLGVDVRYIKPSNQNAESSATEHLDFGDRDSSDAKSRRYTRGVDRDESSNDEQVVLGTAQRTLPSAGHMEHEGEFSGAETRIRSGEESPARENSRPASPHSKSPPSERVDKKTESSPSTNSFNDDSDQFSSDRENSIEDSDRLSSNSNPRLQPAPDESIDDLEVISSSDAHSRPSDSSRSESTESVPSLSGPSGASPSKSGVLEDDADFDGGRNALMGRGASSGTNSGTSTGTKSRGDDDRALAVRAIEDDDIPIRPRGAGSDRPKPSASDVAGGGLLSDELDVMSPTADSDSNRNSGARSDAPANRNSEFPQDDDVPLDEPRARSNRGPRRSRDAASPDAADDRASEGDDSPEFSLPKVVKDSPKAQLELAKEAPSDATLGQPMVYQIRVKNTGGMPAYKVVIRDPIPDGVDLKGTIPQAELASKALVWRFESLEPREEKVIKVRVIPRVVGTVGSVATATFSTQRQQTVTPAGLVSQPQTGGVSGNLKFELIGPRRAVLNGPVLFKFVVKNTGRTRATNVMIRDVLSPHFKHADGDDLECPLGVLAPGETREEELELTAVKPGEAVNQAVLTADGGISIEARAVVEIAGGSISVRRTGPKQLALERNGNYTITVENNGDLPLRDVELIEQLPTGLTFEKAGEGGRFDAARRSIVWRLGDLPAGESQAVTSTLTAKTRGSHVAVIRVTDANGASGETVGTTIVAGAAALSIDLRDWPASVAAGDEFSFTVRVVNKGTEPATGVSTAISLPAEVRLVLAKGPTNHRTSGEMVVFDAVDEIEPEKHVDYTVRLSARSTGDAVLQVTTQSDRMSRPVRRDEVVPILGESVSR